MILGVLSYRRPGLSINRFHSVKCVICCGKDTNRCREEIACNGTSKAGKTLNFGKEQIHRDFGKNFEKLLLLNRIQMNQIIYIDQ